MRRRESRWNTPFGRWVSDHGVKNLARDLSTRGEPIHVNAIYLWIEGATIPRPVIALKLVAIAGERLTLQQIYEHRRLIDTGETVGVSHED